MSRKASGFKAWVLQRVSAVYLAAYFLYLLAYFALCPPASHGEFTAWLAAPLVGVATALFLASLLLHAWIGLRDVVIDYIHPLEARLAALAVVALLLLACAVSFAFSLLRVYAVAV